jgi:hypothetical protein
MSDSPLKDAFRKLLRQPSFLVAAGVLLISAISLNAATAFMKLYFKKVPVEMAAPWNAIPSHLGHWMLVSKDERLPEDVEHTLGATNYLYRDYVDDRIVPADVIAKFEGKSFSERKQMAAQLQQMRPDAVINVGLTYYTGMVDTVAHVPDRCYIADGYEPSTYEVQTWTAFQGRPGRAEGGDIRFINFEDQIASRRAASKNVAYVFNANGTYTCDPIQVRVLLQDLTQRYAYYSKIELMMQMNKPEEASKAMNDFLTSALPEVEKCLPDWKKITAPVEKK